MTAPRVTGSTAHADPVGGAGSEPAAGPAPVDDALARQHEEPATADAADEVTGRSARTAAAPTPGAAAAPRAGSATDECATVGPGRPPRSSAAAADGGPGGARQGRRGPADPVKALIHRHRELCEQAVDPLEIAAGLEAHGVTDRTAARFRHRDVFALAEEMYARVPRGMERTAATVRPARAADPRAGRAFPAPVLLLPVLPGAVCALTVAGTAGTGGLPRLVVGVTGAAAAAVSVALCLRHGPLRAKGRSVASVRMWTLFLLVHAAYGQGFLYEVIAGGPGGAWPMDPAPLVGLALAVLPAAWCAHLFSVLARRRLQRSRSLDEFAAGARPLLLAALVLYAGTLLALLTVTGPVFPGSALVPTAALGTLLFLARLLIVHGCAGPAATALAAACAAEAAAPALLLVGRLPGLEAVARPVEVLVAAWGVTAVPALACGVAALGLLARAVPALSRASAHTP